MNTVNMNSLTVDSTHNSEGSVTMAGRRVFLRDPAFVKIIWSLSRAALVDSNARVESARISNVWIRSLRSRMTSQPFFVLLIEY